MSPPLQLGVVAGETSGDILGASVLRALREHRQLGDVYGVGGPFMLEQGLDLAFPLDRLAVMGLVEPLKRLPELLARRRQLYHAMSQRKIDVFLGIDSPDFNLGLERMLRAEGIKTVHLVSPSVWAWRAGRIKTIKASVDLMLCLLPFEVPIYEAAGIAAVCVGHPLVEELTMLPDRATARSTLGLPDAGTLLGVLPGSRANEVAHLMPLFAQSMRRLMAEDRLLQCVIPAATPERKAQIVHLLGQEWGADPAFASRVHIVDGQGRLTMIASDALMVASGTATLEAMLLQRPMVIAYRMAPLSWWILSRMATTAFVGLPNILAGRRVVPELLQEAATESALTAEVRDLLTSGGQVQVAVFRELADRIGSGYSQRAAEAILGLV